MPIISISRDTPNNVSLVRISTTDTLATVATPDYILNQMPVINELNRGVWGWFISDTVLVAAIDGNALYEFTDNTFSSLILLGGVTSGTVLPGLQNQIAVYPAVGNKVEGSSALPALVQVSTGSLNSGINAVSNTFWAGDGTWKTVASATSHSKYAVYVSGDGNDSTGNGSINAPYKTVVKAMSTITTNTITTPFNICLLGGTITETLSLAFKPFVSIVGLSESVIWHLASTSLDASWGTTTGATMTLSNFTWNSNPIFMDFSAFTNVDSPIIYINNVFGSSGLVCKGSANNNPNFFISDCVLISMNYSNCFVQLDSSQVVTLKANSAKLDANLAPNTLYSVGCTLGTTIIAGQNSGPSTTATFYGTRFSTGGLTGDGLTVLLLQDASSYVSPILLNSATSNIVSISNGLLANYTPVNYTPVATPPTSTSSVQAHLHGIDNALTSITSSNNYIYVSNTGNDVSGNGSIEKPYATVAHAETVITTATSNNPFTIVMIGGTIIESGSVTLKPFINVTASSENVIWQLSGLMALDASWSTTSAGMVVFSNFSFNTFDIVLDFSSETNVATHTIIFSNINSLGRSISVYGSTNTVPTSYCSNCLLFSYVVENSIAYLNSNILSGSFLMGQFNPIVATATAYLLANRIGANVTITGATSGGILSTIHFYSSRIAGSLTINNVNAAVNIDAVSYKVPTVSGGGVINLTSISNGLSANYSPVNYTPVAVAPDLPTSVHAHLAGIDAKLGIISPATNPFNTVYVNSNGGVDAVGNGSILKPYLTIEFALSQITTASSSNIYFMQCYGIFTPVTLNLKPWVFINGNNSSLTSSNPIGKDVAWSTTAGTVYFSNFQLNANITMDLSANTAPTIIYLEKLINPLTTPTFTFTGVTQLNIVGCENSVGSKIALSITNCSCNIQNCSLGAVSFTYSIHISPVYYLYLIGNSFLSGSSSSLSLTTSSTAGVFAAASGNIFQGTALTITAPTGAPTFSCNNATGFNSITLSGANSTFIPDMLSVTPTFSGGASATNISYASLAASITAGFTPVNYTPATPQVKSHLQAIDAVLGGGITTPGQLVYVSNTGSDSTGNGSFNKPYQTIAFAMNSITSPSVTNIYTMVLLSNLYNETVQIQLKENVNIFAYSPNTRVTTTLTTIVNTSSWAGTTPRACYSNIYFRNDVTADFSTLLSTPGSGTQVTFNNCQFFGVFSVRGNGFVVNNAAILFNCLFYNTSFIDCTDLYSSTGCLFNKPQSFGTISTSVTLHALKYGDCHPSTFGGGIVVSGAAGSQQQIVLSGCNTTSLTINGSNALIDTDSVSYVVPTGAGASTATINLRTVSNALNANYTPVNYTPVATAPDLTTSVHANLRGIDNKLGVISPATNPFTMVYVCSNGGVDAVGNGSILKPYLTITFALTQITDNTATKRYVVSCQGSFTDTVSMKPWVLIEGNGSIITNGTTFNLDSSFVSTTNGLCYINNFIVASGVASSAITWNFASTNVTPRVYIGNLKLATQGNWNITGPSNGTINGIIENVRSLTISNVASNIFGTIQNFAGSITNCYFAGTVNFNTTSGSGTHTVFLNGSSFFGCALTFSTSGSSGVLNVYGSGNNYSGSTLSVTGTSGGGSTLFNSTGCDGFTAISVNLTNVTFSPDLLSVVPTFSGGATMATNVVFQSLSHSIKGTTTNDNAPVGNIQEYISSSVLVGSAVSLTTVTPANVTSISLTAGDWMISGTVFFQAGGSTVTNVLEGGISTTSATLPTAGSENNLAFGVGASGVTSYSVGVGSTRLSLSGTTTVFLVAEAIFSVSTMTAYGFIGARRVR